MSFAVCSHLPLGTLSIAPREPLSTASRRLVTCPFSGCPGPARLTADKIGAFTEATSRSNPPRSTSRFADFTYQYHRNRPLKTPLEILLSDTANAKPLATVALMIGTRGVCEQYSRPAFAGGTCDVH